MINSKSRRAANLVFIFDPFETGPGISGPGCKYNHEIDKGPVDRIGSVASTNINSLFS
jgi:hypothetical protein